MGWEADATSAKKSCRIYRGDFGGHAESIAGSALEKKLLYTVTVGRLDRRRVKAGGRKKVVLGRKVGAGRRLNGWNG